MKSPDILNPNNAELLSDAEIARLEKIAKGISGPAFLADMLDKANPDTVHEAID